MTRSLPVIQTPPSYCEYAAGPCDQSFSGFRQVFGTFLYASRPQTIAATIKNSVDRLRKTGSGRIWTTWEEHPATGQLVFCAICRSLRFADVVVADVTTLNFNVLFELGYALGLGLPVVPIRDTTLLTSTEDFQSLGLLDTLGYVDFQNSEELAAILDAKLPVPPIGPPATVPNSEAPLYAVKGSIPTEGDLRFMATLRRSAVRFRSLDIIETPRISLYELRRQVSASLAVAVHLLSPARKGALVHNARCALVAGIAMAEGKAVLMLEEGVNPQPIDYRDLLSSYQTPNAVPGLVEPFLREVIALLQDGDHKSGPVSEGALENLDLGDTAAENESQSLKYYFVRTAQFGEARRGSARLIVGRKGAGKTALFYGIRDSMPKGHNQLLLELKPEGHQFTKLREAVLERLSTGLQEHTLTAFWNYILLCELTEQIREVDYSWAQRQPDRLVLFDQVIGEYSRQVPATAGDFSERLLRQVERMEERFAERGSTRTVTGGELTQALFRGEIERLDDVLAPYLEEKKDVWVLVDNLDKGWPTRGTRSSDILILRTLLEATRKLQRQLERRGVGFHSMVFLRNDIYDHLLTETADRGKDTAIMLEWDDIESFRQLIQHRVRSSVGRDLTFAEAWAAIADPFVDTHESFDYMLRRTLMRPRDLLVFVQRAIGVAINRRHSRATGEDILKAEDSYSDDMLLNTAYELRDVHPDMVDVLYVFQSAPLVIARKEVTALIARAHIPEASRTEILRLLAWFGFLGVVEDGKDDPLFSYQMRYNIDKLLAPIDLGRGAFSVHPAFHRALAIDTT